VVPKPHGWLTPSEAAFLRAHAAGFGVALDHEALARLGRFVGLLETWNRRIRLTGDCDRRATLRRHVLDSLAALPHLPSAGLVVDVGSGAGFPGIVLGCVRPEVDLVLVESRRRPVMFLREVMRELPLPRARALELRAEDLACDSEFAAGAKVVISRALRLDAFLALAAPLLSPSGTVVAMQTPRVRPGAEAAGAAHGLRLVAVRDYELPAAGRRSLFLFAHATATAAPVS
jgi:16S rRNA (guanine527-N7)-methyltransferase